MKTYPVLGIPLHLPENSQPTNLSTYALYLQERSSNSQGTQVITLNAEMVMQARQNPALKQVIHQAECVVPDGAGVVLYLRTQGQKVQRCPGIELAENLLHWSITAHKTIFLIGAKPEIIDRVAQIWSGRSAQVIGQHHGYFLNDQSIEHELLKTLEKLQPDLILVGLGVPRQELWISANRHLCPRSIWIGVGGSFDVWSGQKQRAPQWMQNVHLEWLYRLYQEPWRWRRMLVLPQFVWVSLWAVLGGTFRNSSGSH